MSTLTGYVGKPFSYDTGVVADTANGGYARAEHLPPGLGYSSSTGAISGTPTDTGSWTMVVINFNSDGTQKEYLTIPVTINAGTITISGSPPIHVVKSTGYSYTPSVSPSDAVLTVSGADWLSVNGHTISGTAPSSMYVYSVTVTATRSHYTSASQSWDIAVVDSPQVSISGNPSTSGTVGQAYSATFTLSPSDSVMTVNGADWLSVHGNTISGTPTEAKTYGVVIIAGHSGYTNRTYTYSLTVGTAGVVTISGDFPTEGTEGVEYKATPHASPSGATMTLSGVPWLTLSDGVITGTPTATGTYTATLTAAYTGYTSGTHSWTIAVTEAQAVSGTGLSENSPIILDNTLNWELAKFSEGATKYCYVCQLVSPDKCFTQHSLYLPSSVTTTDTQIFAVTDLDGSIAATLPWGAVPGDVKYRVVLSTLSCYLQIRLDGMNSGAEGMNVTIPAKRIATSSNSWSDYVYSGQRETEINSRNLSNQMALVNGIATAGSGAAQGAMMGGLKSGGAAAGMSALGAASGIIGTVASYAVANNYAPKLQKISNYANAMQLDTCILPGDGVDSMIFGRDISLIRLDCDEYSVTQRANDISLNGANVSEPTANCQPLLAAGGPLQIEDVTVLGDAPNAAKSYIRERLNNGVRIV